MTLSGPWDLTRVRRHLDETARDAPPPYRGVRGHGRAELLPEQGLEILTALVDRYLGDRHAPLARWLLGRDTKRMGPS